MSSSDHQWKKIVETLAEINSWEKFGHKIKEIMQRDSSPESLARGMAVGMFWGVSIFWGLQAILAFICARFWRGNAILAALLTLISNPITTVPLYSFAFYIGQLLIPVDVKIDLTNVLDSWRALLAMGPQALIVFIVGSTVMGLVLAILSYFATKLIYPRVISK